MLVEDQSALERIENFTKFARFISQKFGVVVVLDGVEAKTDGNTIYLPNLTSATPDEVDFLYCVLLHEVGHIRHSKFSDDLFKKLKSQAHFLIFNAIEDARIENKLMKEYDGAEEYFDELYHKFAIDNKFWKKVFGFDPKDTDKFMAMAIYIHYTLLDLKHKVSMDKALTKKAANKVRQLSIKGRLDRILRKAKIRTPEDVLRLSNIIYKLYFKKTKDRSKANEIPKQEKVVDKVLEDLKRIQQDLQAKEKQFKSLREKIKGLREDVKSDKVQTEPYMEKLDQLYKDLEKVEGAKWVFDDKEDSKKKIVECDKQMLSYKDRIRKKLKQIEKLKQEIEGAKAQGEQVKKDKEKVPWGDKGKWQKKLDRLSSKISNLVKKIHKAEKVQKNYENKIAEREVDKRTLEADIRKLEQEAKKITETPDQLNQQVKDLAKQSGTIENQKEVWDKKINEKRSKIEEIRTKLKEMQKQATAPHVEDMKKLQEMCDKAGIPIEVSPKFKPIPGWDGGNKTQQEFDAKASGVTQRPVINGGFTGTSVRDVLVLVDKNSNGLKEIDLAEIFKKNHNVSKLDSFNDVSKVKNTREDDIADGTTVRSVRRHVPLTTEFDKTKTENRAMGNKLVKLKISNRDLIKKVQDIFRQKLKFKKKIRFKGAQDEGYLDDRAMWKIAADTGDDDFYEIPHPQRVNQVVASIAVDVSGSMEKKISARQTLLQEIAVVLSEALNACYIKHEVCGYHAPVCDEMRSMPRGPTFNRTNNNLETIVYKGFNDRQNVGIENMEVQCTDNSDGESLRIISKRLFRQQSRRKILFVVTDGKPFLSGSDTNVLDRDLKDALLWLQNNKVEVYPIGLNPHAKDLFGRKFFMLHKPEDLIDFANKVLEA